MSESASSHDIEGLRSWIGKRSFSVDTMTSELVRRFQATFNYKGEGVFVPLGIHWCLSPDVALTKQLWPDGHPPRGAFMPPVNLPRRMWAGSRLAFSDQLQIGDEVQRESCIEDVSFKQGRSGQLCFVSVGHVYSTQRGPAITERQEIVYRGLEERRVSAPVRHPSDASPAVSIPFDASTVVLFRYSALTFNGHRIHYDQSYATNDEGYAGLIVHGPLQATVMLLLAEQLADGKPIQSFSFRGVQPLVAGVFLVNGQRSESRAELWTSTAAGGVHMTAEASW